MGLLTRWPGAKYHREFRYKHSHEGIKMDNIWIAVIILIVLWLAGWGFAIGGGLIHLLLIVILALIAYRLLTKRNPIA